MTEWPEDEKRIDIIGSNGNDGLHYEDQKLICEQFEEHVKDTCDYLKGNNGESE